MAVKRGTSEMSDGINPDEFWKGVTVIMDTSENPKVPKRERAK
jgi:hypothetical protein